MSRLLFSTALAGLLLSAGAAMAQPPSGATAPGSPGMPNYQNFWGPGNDRNNNAQNNNGRRDGDRSGNRGGQATPPAASNGNSNNFRRDDDRGRDFRNNGNNDRRDYGNRNDRRDWNRGGGYRNNNWSSYQRNFRSPQRYRGPSYVRPRGWYSQRWTYGQILPSLFWTSNYWINNYNSYGLQAPPPGTVWVRDGFDAILIDRYDGQIIQVVYDVYY